MFRKLIFKQVFKFGFPKISQLNERLLKVYCKFLQVFAPLPPKPVLQMSKLRIILIYFSHNILIELFYFYKKIFLL